MSCHELKKGDILVCPDCGLEVKVTKACNCADEGVNACTDEGFKCCGGLMQKK
jgi:hypothetical protein